MSEAGNLMDLIKVRKQRESVILIFCKERVECPCAPGILNYKQGGVGGGGRGEQGKRKENFKKSK